ncbi:MAG: penicillin-binding protein 2 [Acidimicrobiales bacterium]
MGPVRSSAPARYAPKAVERSPGLDEEQKGRVPASSLKRLEEEEREQARRAETVRVGLRLTVMGVVVLGLFSIMIFRLWSLQVLNSSSARDQVISLTTRDVPITPPRGLIEARGGQVLVSNKVEPVVTLNRQIAATNPAVVQRLAVTLGMSLASVKAAINDEQDSIYQPVPIEVGVPDSVVVYLSEHKSMFPGVTVSNVAERQFPYGDLMAQTLGYVADISAPELKQLKGQGYTAGDVIGQSGIEASYESYLRGVTGVRELSVDAQGDPVATKHVVPSKAGDDVVTNIDLGLQQAAEADLSAQIASLDAQGKPVNSGAVVALDPQTGAILAMASEPTYDPSWWVGGMSTQHYSELNTPNSNYPLLNRAIQGLYTPGSTFKLASSTAGLNDGLISPYTVYPDNGSFTIPRCTGGGCTFADNTGDVPCYNACDVSTALTVSDDVFFYTLGFNFYSDPKQYGNDPIQKVAAQYGFGVSSGIDLPGAYYGQVDSPELRVQQHAEDPSAFPDTYYGAGDAVNAAFGQGETEITPLELANAYATFANGGTRYAPEVGAAIVSPDGKVVKRIEPKVVGHVSLPASTRQAILTGLEGVTTATGRYAGTATQALVALHYPYSQLPIAGKTGTSQVSSSTNAQPDSLFVAFGPVSDPQYVIAVIIPNAGYGALAAAPVVIKLFEYLIQHPVGPVTPKAPTGAG